MHLRFLALGFVFSSCFTKPTTDQETVNPVEVREIITKEFQGILDSTGLHGAILLLDQELNTFYSNDFNWCRQGKLPASTYKIPNSIIALESNVVADAHIIFTWDGQPRGLAIWEQDLSFKEAFQRSCVPCYQEIARNIGVDQMNTYLAKLEYGKMTVDSSNIDIFWLTGTSRINQFEQIDFLYRFYHSDLLISDRTHGIMSDLLLIDSTPKYQLSGKTGWSQSDQGDNGWFVGYLEANDNVYYFATNVEPMADFDMDHFPEVRKEITYDALELMGYWKR